MGLFTGLAFHVPGTESATVSIQVYSAEGVKTGETQFVMPAGSRQSRLLTEFIPFDCRTDPGICDRRFHAAAGCTRAVCRGRLDVSRSGRADHRVNDEFPESTQAVASSKPIELKQAAPGNGRVAPRKTLRLRLLADLIDQLFEGDPERLVLVQSSRTEVAPKSVRGQPANILRVPKLEQGRYMVDPEQISGPLQSVTTAPTRRAPQKMLRGSVALVPALV